MNRHPVPDVASTDSRPHLTRTRFFSLLAGAIGAALGIGSMTGAAAQCRKKSARCDSNAQCCSKRCKRGFCYPKRR